MERSRGPSRWVVVVRWCGGGVLEGRDRCSSSGMRDLLYCKSRVWTGGLEVALACADLREVLRDYHVDFRDIQADGV